MSKRKHIIEIARSIPVNDEQWMQKFLTKLCAMEPSLPAAFSSLNKEQRNDTDERAQELRPRV